MALLRIVAVVVTVIGIIGIAAALWAEKKKEQQWVSSNAEITARIKPFEEEKRVLEKQDKEWLQRLENTRNGGTCVLLGFANANQTLTQDTLQIMTEYGYRGTFPLQNGLVPGSSPELMSMEAFHGMLGSGWEYVFQTESPGGEDEEQWVQQLDAQIAAWNGAGIGTPGDIFSLRAKFREQGGRSEGARIFGMGGSAAVRRLYWESGRWCTSGEDCGSVKACNDDGVCPHECDKQKEVGGIFVSGSDFSDRR